MHKAVGIQNHLVQYGRVDKESASCAYMVVNAVKSRHRVLHMIRFLYVILYVEKENR